jgi:hypothetical protein
VSGKLRRSRGVRRFSVPGTVPLRICRATLRGALEPQEGEAAWLMRGRQQGSVYDDATDELGAADQSPRALADDDSAFLEVQGLLVHYKQAWPQVGRRRRRGTEGLRIRKRGEYVSLGSRDKWGGAVLRLCAGQCWPTKDVYLSGWVGGWDLWPGDTLNSAEKKRMVWQGMTVWPCQQQADASEARAGRRHGPWRGCGSDPRLRRRCFRVAAHDGAAGLGLPLPRCRL